MKKIYITLLLISFSFISFSQVDYYEQPDNIETDTNSLFERKFLYGGNMGLNFGSYTKISASPKIAYPVFTWTSIGAGGDFIYYSFGGFKAFMYGANTFADFFVLKAFTLHFEYAMLNVETFKYYPNKIDRKWNTAKYVGAGYRQMLSDKAYVTYLFLWDFNYSDITPFANPTYRFTFYF